MNRDKQVIGALFWHDKRLLEQYIALRLQADDFTDPVDAKLYAWILEAYRANVSIKPASMAAYTKDAFAPGTFDTYRDAGYDLTMGEALDLAKFVIGEAEVRWTGRGLHESLRELEGGKPLKEVKAGLSRKLQTTRGVIAQDSSPRSIRQRIDARIERGEWVKITPTRLEWFDSLFDGGLTEKDIIGIGGAQKRRKTTVARWLALNAAINKDGMANKKVSIAFCTFENDQESTYWDFVAMLAVRCALAKDWYQEKIINEATGELVVKHDGHNLTVADILNPRQIRKAYERKRLAKWNAHAQECVRYAMAMMDDLNIYIYDRTQENGALRSLESLKACTQLHHFAHVTPEQHYLVFVDYAQLVISDGEIFKDMRLFSDWMIEAAQGFPCTMVCMAQLNEASNKDRAKGDKSDYLGIKGGGDFLAAVFYMIAVEYDKKNPTELPIRLAESRKAGTAWARFEIHPATGYPIAMHH